MKEPRLLGASKGNLFGCLEEAFAPGVCTSASCETCLRGGANSGRQGLALAEVGEKVDEAACECHGLQNRWSRRRAWRYDSASLYASDSHQFEGHKGASPVNVLAKKLSPDHSSGPGTPLRLGRNRRPRMENLWFSKTRVNLRPTRSSAPTSDRYRWNRLEDLPAISFSGHSTMVTSTPTTVRACYPLGLLRIRKQRRHR